MPEELRQGTSALVHRFNYEEDKLTHKAHKAQLQSSEIITMTLNVASQNDRLALCSLDKNKEKVIRESFYFLRTTNFFMQLGRQCEEYIAVYTGKDFMLLKGSGNFSQQLADHPMMKDVIALSKTTLKTFGYSSLEAVITGKNVIYVALLYMNDTPAYYVGKASNGIKDRWCQSQTAHCRAVNSIIRCFESSPGFFEPVIHHQLCDLAIAGAVLQQVATRSANGVALFAIDFCSEGKTQCCPSHKRDVLDHHEQHYITAFKDLFPNSDTEPKMKCLNATDSCKCHDCSDGDVYGCSTEVALSVFLHDLQLA